VGLTSQLRQFVRRGGLNRQWDYALRIEGVAQALAAEWTGTVRTTFARHEVKEHDVGKLAAEVSSPRAGGILLHEVARLLRPRWTVELGSAFGIGSLYLAAALTENGAGRLDGIEFEPWRADLANQALQTHYPGVATIHAGPIEELLPRLAAERGGWDLAFVDAWHTYGKCMDYHRLLLETMALAGVWVVYDDITWSKEMEQFWAELVALPVVTDAAAVRNRWGVIRYRGRS
jgi:predicted O-methyltransferase YrrM